MSITERMRTLRKALQEDGRTQLDALVAELRANEVQLRTTTDNSDRAGIAVLGDRTAKDLQPGDFDPSTPLRISGKNGRLTLYFRWGSEYPEVRERLSPIVKTAKKRQSLRANEQGIHLQLSDLSVTTTELVKTIKDLLT